MRFFLHPFFFLILILFIFSENIFSIFQSKSSHLFQFQFYFFSFTFLFAYIPRYFPLYLCFSFLSFPFSFKITFFLCLFSSLCFPLDISYFINFLFIYLLLLTPSSSSSSSFSLLFLLRLFTPASDMYDRTGGQEGMGTRDVPRSVCKEGKEDKDC